VIDHVTPLADWLVIAPVLLCLLGAAVLLMLRSFIRVQRWVGGAVLVAVLVCDGLLFQRVLEDGPLTMTMGKWLPPFGISFTADVMGAGFALVSAFVSLCVWVYVQSDTPESAVRDGIYPLILLLVAGVTGSFLTGDLFNLYVWFEVMLIASFGLIILAGQPLQLDGAVKYGVLNFLATTLFLAGLGLLYGLLGTLNMADIIGAAAAADPAPLAAVGALIALAFGVKAAMFPVNAWLPASYHTPPPAISALLGGLLTKVGVYAFVRTLVMVLPTVGEYLAPTIAILGIATMILGPLSAIAETNLRRAIGFLLIGGVGVTILSVASGNETALAGGLAYVAHSMLTISALYLVMAGGGGAILSFILILAISGIPPFLGFWPKLLLLQGFIGAGEWPYVFAILLNALLTLIAGVRLWSGTFWRSPLKSFTPNPAFLLLTTPILLLGLWPEWLIRAATVAARDLLAPARYIASVGLAP